MQQRLVTKKPISGRILNCTGHRFWCYSEEGSPVAAVTVTSSAIPEPKTGTYVVVDKETYKKLRMNGRSTSDLVCATCTGKGINDLPVSMLYTYDGNVRVMPTINW